MTDTALVLSEFIAAWQAGERPRLGDYLKRVPESEQRELAEQIQLYISIAPEPDYSAEAWSEMIADPMIASVAAAAMEPEPWPELLPRLRMQAKMSLKDIAIQLGLRGAAASKAERFLGEMESGELEPTAPTRTLLERLAAILNVAPEALDWRGRTAPGAPALALYRASAEASDDLDLVVGGLLADGGWDDVDELFLGGRD
jgi:transcriptional regulator with XRE-family HTH domain